MQKLKDKILAPFSKSPPTTLTSKGDYYTVSDKELSRLEYKQLSIAPPQNVYVMRQFGEENLESLFERQLSEHQRYYRDNGYLILRDFIPHDLIDRYLELREQLDLDLGQLPQANTPHVKYQSIRDICSYGPLVDVIRELHSMELGLIFALTGFKSTLRGWHQDSYLDNDQAVPRCATWIALGDVTEDCGPFEYVPGSNRWPALSNERINEFVKGEYRWPHGHRKAINGAPRWGRMCEKFIDPVVFSKIEREKASVKQFVASKGDVLIWYGRLMHRGSEATAGKGTKRPGLIGHYAPVGERERGLFAKRKDGSYFLVPQQSFDMLEGSSDLV